LQFTTNIFTSRASNEIVSNLSADTELATRARKLLCTQFLWTAPYDLNCAVALLPTSDSASKARWLMHLGVLLHDSAEQLWYFASRFVGSLLLARMPLPHNALPTQPFPFRSDGSIDFCSMFKLAVQSFRPTAITSLCAGKKAHPYPSVRTLGVVVPNEYTYQSELAAVLRAWAPVEVQVHPEVRTSSKSRCDFVLIHNSIAYGIELLATGKPHQMEEHIDRAAAYATELKLEHIWVLHITEKFPTADSFRWPGPLEASVSAMVCYHDAKFENLRFWVYSPKSNIIQTTLDEEQHLVMPLRIQESDASSPT